MTALIALPAQVLNVLLMLAAAPLLVGLIRRVEARRAGRHGPPLLQPWRDLIRLARKQPMLTDGASLLFESAPAVSFAISLAAAALIPSFALGMAGAKLADLIVIAGLLLLCRCVLALAAMDSGTAQGGGAAAREMGAAAFTGPALLLAILVLGRLAGTTNLDALAMRMGAAQPSAAFVLALAALALMGIAPAPPQAPDYAGRHLALIEYGAALRLTAWLSLLALLTIRLDISSQVEDVLWWPAGLLVWAAKVTVLAGALAVWRGSGATARAALGMALLLGSLAALLVVAG